MSYQGPYLNPSSFDVLVEVITGGSYNSASIGPYRTSSQLITFFSTLGLKKDLTSSLSRKKMTEEVLVEINLRDDQAKSLKLVIESAFLPANWGFKGNGADTARQIFNTAAEQDGIILVRDGARIKLQLNKNEDTATMEGNGKIFISHATGDKQYAEVIENFLVEFCGIPRSRFFRSTGEYNGITSGKNFRTFMEQEIKQCSLVISLVTPLYMERPFCQMEVGSVWLLGNPCIPIITDTNQYSYISQVFGEIQAHCITDFDKLFALREAMNEYVKMEPPKNDEASSIARKFKRKLNNIEKLLGNRETVSKAEMGLFNTKLKEAELDRDSAEEELDALKEKYKKLFLTKTATEAKHIGSSDAKNFKEQLDNYLSEIKLNIPNGMIGAVAIDLGIIHSGGSSDINYEDYNDGFETATSHGYINSDDGTCNSDNRHMRKFLASIDDMVTFLDQQDDIQELEEQYDLDLNPTIKPFWTDTLDLKGVDMTRSGSR